MSKKVVETAIKRHDEDANWFQNTYEREKNQNEFSEFLYGRKFVLDELEKALSTLPKGSKVLDMGSGTGHLTHAIQEQGYEVVGVEPSDKMRDLAEANFPNITFKKGISSDTGLPDEQFDLIVAFEVLRYLDKEENTNSYKEFYRLLKPGGKFFVTHVNRFATDGYFFYYYINKWSRDIRGMWYQNCYFTTPAQEEKLIEEAGFTEIQSIGRLSATVRIASRINKSFAKSYSKWLESIFGNQRFTQGPKKHTAGHLILIGKK